MCVCHLEQAQAESGERRARFGARVTRAGPPASARAVTAPPLPAVRSPGRVLRL
jgi:hypothetical protein